MHHLAMPAHCWHPPDHLPELRLMAWEVSAAKTPLGVAALPINYYHSLVRLSTTTPHGVFQFPVGFSTHSLTSNRCPRQPSEPTTYQYLSNHHLSLRYTDGNLCLSDMNPSNLSVSAAEPAAEAPSESAKCAPGLQARLLC